MLTTHVIAKLALAATLACLVPAARASDWADDYRRGLEALEKDDLRAARRSFERAVAEEPRSHATARTYGARSIGYFPYLQLSRVAYRERDLKAAQRHLAQEMAEAQVGQTPEGRALLQEQQLLLENLELIQAAEQGGATVGDRTVTRTERDRQREALLSQQVAQQCGERRLGKPDRMPWYYHYALAQKLAAHDDWIGALAHLSWALDRRGEPGEWVRTYGMGFVDYRPWLEMGRAHGHLGNWECARDALELSTQKEPLGDDDAADARQRDDLLRGARLRVEPAAGGGRL
jgi:hypothetical protein